MKVLWREIQWRVITYGVGMSWIVKEEFSGRWYLSWDLKYKNKLAVQKCQSEKCVGIETRNYKGHSIRKHLGIWETEWKLMGLAYCNQEHDGGDFVEVDRSLICQPKNNIGLFVRQWEDIEWSTKQVTGLIYFLNANCLLY